MTYHSWPTFLTDGARRRELHACHSREQDCDYRQDCLYRGRHRA